MALQQWAVPHLQTLLPPLDGAELEQLVLYASTLPDDEAARHLEGLLGDSPQSVEFIESFIKRRAELNGGQPGSQDDEGYAPPPGPPPSSDEKTGDSKHSLASNNPYASNDVAGASSDHDSKTPLPPSASAKQDAKQPPPQAPPPAYSAPSKSSGRAMVHQHTNAVIAAGHQRARDEQQMQQMLQDLQYQYRIYNSEIEPEHEADYYCSCAIHQYQRVKIQRLNVQNQWSRAVMYPGESTYNDLNQTVFSSNPYAYRVVSPFGYRSQMTLGYNSFRGYGVQIASPNYHAQFIHQTIALNNQLNQDAQINIDAREPKQSIWDLDALAAQLGGLALGDQKGGKPAPAANDGKEKTSKLTGFRKALGIKSSEEKAVGKANDLRQAILAEEDGRWQDEQWRQLVAAYQDKVGMRNKIAHLRGRCPIQYLHLLRAGYLEPIPVAWATSASNPLKFSIEAKSGWRGITPAWRGYEDLAEERLYWVLNHREGSVGMRLKPDFISTLNMAWARMATAVEPPPLYFSANDTCHLQHTSSGYSKQVMPPPFRAFDRPETPSDDTMILLDVSGSMDFEPVRPLYDQYLITQYTRTTQPKNKDVARAIVRRFTDAMANHDHQSEGYDLITFANSANHIGTINHRNLEWQWRSVRFGGGTRVMTGWQKVKDLHFRKHSESAVHHPVYGWQAGPQTPMLRLLLLLDGEATDMDEFELDLLGLSWAHVTIFLIGVDGCPHHHRHANELARISDVNHHVSFVDAQGNCPERFVTHELLKRHLGYDISMQEFEQLEELPAYSVTA